MKFEGAKILDIFRIYKIFIIDLLYRCIRILDFKWDCFFQEKVRTKAAIFTKQKIK